MIGETPCNTAQDAFDEKKPELLQARVESTMEAVEETMGAEPFPLGCSLAARYAALQYFCVNKLELCL